MPSRTRENTITGLLTSYLRDKGIEAVSPVGLEMPGEWPKEPDFEIRNEGIFVGEAKWSKDFYQAIAEARDYGLAPTVNGTIAIGYPESLRRAVDQGELLPEGLEKLLGAEPFPVAFLARDSATDLQRLDLAEIPDWIESHIHRRREPFADPEEVVAVLRQTANALTREIEEVEAPDLFRNVLGVEPEEAEEAEAAKRAAGYLLVNQITFYRVLSAEKQGRYPEMDPSSLQKPSDFKPFFDRVLEDNYAAIFSLSVVDHYADHHIGLLQRAVKSIYGLRPEQINHEVLGTVFHQLTPLSVRKPLAAFYTKQRSAEILAALAIDEAEDRVFDPACGTGQLLSAAYRRKRSLSQDFDEENHRRFLESEITGTDIMPFAAHLSTIHLALEQPAYQTDHVRIGIADSTRLRPGEMLDPLTYVLPESLQGQADLFDEPDELDKWVEGGAIPPDKAERTRRGILLDMVDVVIMNPPFSRQESVAHFGRDYKDRLVERLGLYERFIHRKMSYCSYFLLLADRFVEEGGRIAAVLPASFLTKASDRKVREFLLDEYHLLHLAGRRDKPNFSEDTDLREILLVAEKGSTSGPTTYIFLDGLSHNPATVRDLAKNTPFGERSSNGCAVRAIPEKALSRENLFGPFAVERVELFDVLEDVVSSPSVSRLEELSIGLIGGVGSGGKGIDPESKEKDWQQGVINAESVSGMRDHDVWIFEDEDDSTVTARHRHLSLKVRFSREILLPDFRRTPNRALLDVSGLREYVVIDEPEDDTFFKFAGFEFVPRNWEGEVRSRLGRLALLRRTDLTAPGTRHLCYFSQERRAFHGTLWVGTDLRVDDAKILALWFDSSFNLLQLLVNRVPGRGGYTEFHRYTVEEFAALNQQKLEIDDREKLLGLFSAVGNTEFPALYKQLAQNVSPEALTTEEKVDIDRAFDGLSSLLGEGFSPRRRIDEAMMDHISLSDDRSRYLSDLYKNLLLELTGLKLMMSS